MRGKGHGEFIASFTASWYLPKNRDERRPRTVCYCGNLAVLWVTPRRPPPARSEPLPGCPPRHRFWFVPLVGLRIPGRVPGALEWLRISHPGTN